MTNVTRNKHQYESIFRRDEEHKFDHENGKFIVHTRARNL